MMKTILSLIVLLPLGLATFDFTNECAGSRERTVTLNDFVYNAFTVSVPEGTHGASFCVESSPNLDLRMTNGTNGVDIVRRWTGVLSSAREETVEWEGDSITYSGFRGGNEYIRFNDVTDRSYTIHGYVRLPLGTATYNYTWIGSDDCLPGNVKGSNSFRQQIYEGSSTLIGTLPAGLTDFQIRLDSNVDGNLELYDGSTKIVGANDGAVLNGTYAL